MSGRRAKLGRRGEAIAVGELTKRGYDVVERNWYCQIGEVDIVAQWGDRWTFFEVRTRRGRAFGTPEESVTARKMKRMADVARLYLSSHSLNVHQLDWRIGVIAVEMDAAGHLLRVEIYEDLW